jgi:hypothetical protein
MIYPEGRQKLTEPSSLSHFETVSLPQLPFISFGDLSIEETIVKINNSGLLPVSHRLCEIYSSLGPSKNSAVVVPDATPAKTER